jgi:Putative porin
MNTVIKWGTILALAGTMAAQTAPPATKKKAHKAVKPAEPAVTQQDVQSLKDTLTLQQQAIEALKSQLQQRDQNWQDAQQKLQAAQASATEANTRAAAIEAGAEQDRAAYNQLSSDMADVKTTLTSSALTTMEDQKRLSAFDTALGRFRFSGDVRVRGESFNQQSTADRNRARIRARFGVEGKLGDFTGGLAVASGSLGDPTSTNESLTNNFDRKTIGLDRAFITYNPSQFKALQVTGGKFAYQWIRTGMTFDPDLNPEGFSEKLSFDLSNPVVKNLTVGAYELNYNEVTAGADSYALGAHASAKLQPFPWWTATASFSATKWNKPDSILQASAFAVQATSGKQIIQIPIVPQPPPGSPQTTPVTISINTPGEGQGCNNPSGIKFIQTQDPNVPPAIPTVILNTSPCVFAPNGMTNALVTDAKGIPHFASGFLYADFIINNQFKTPFKRLPLNVVGEYEDNLDAIAHPLVTDTTTGLTSVRTDLGSQSRGYSVDVSVGQTKNKGDFQVGYAWVRQEQDSAIASFVESDQRAPTNILQNRFYALYKLNPNTTASFTFWHGRTLNTSLQNAVVAAGVNAKASELDHSLNRLQFDLIYSF